jgi:hypothetical protein
VATPSPRPTAGSQAAGEPIVRREAGIWSAGGRLAWIAGLVLMLSAFTGWYSGEQVGDGIQVAVIGWHTGTFGKLVFFLGLLLLVLTVLREAGIALPAAVPQSLVVIAVGFLAMIFVLIRVISIPDEFFFAGRAIGIWIALAAALGVIAAGVLLAAEEL